MDVVDLSAVVPQLFETIYGRSPAILVRAPGRVNLLGAHVDYQEGWVLPTAVNRHLWLAAAPSHNNRVTIQSLNFQQEAIFSLPYLNVHSPLYTFNWINYPIGVAWALQDAGHELAGMDVVFASDIPIGSGMSSSAALEIAFVMAWEALSGFELDGAAKAQVGHRTENEYLGVGSGMMDQMACVFSKAGHLLLIDCRTAVYEHIALPSDTAVLIADSGIHRKLTQINYNARPAECREAVAILRHHLPDIRTLRDVSLDQFELLAHHLPDVLRRRARHVVEECQRVLEGTSALRQEDVVAFGRLMRQSHISSRDNYEVSLPELDLLASTAWRVPGCYGARFGGAGFGGLMQILVAESAVSDVQRAIETAFQEKFGRIPPTFICHPADGAQTMFL